MIQPKETNQLCRKKSIPSNFTFASSFPALASIKALAVKTSNQSRKDAVLKLALDTALTLDALPSLSTKKSKPTTSITSISAQGGIKPLGSKSNQERVKLEDWQVFKAIERKDIMLLMEVRDRQFELLVQPQKGALSRKVNDLTDEEFSTMSSSTKALLRSIRTNLKLAITYGLASSNTDLLASYLQITIMSEGNSWLLNAIGTISLHIRSGEKPVESAEKLFSKWVGKELKDGSDIAAVGEYIANAVGDLVLMGIYSVVTDTQSGEVLPLWFFARDDRISKALAERMEELKKVGSYKKLAIKLRRQIEVSLSITSKRNIGGRQRLVELKVALDG